MMFTHCQRAHGVKKKVIISLNRNFLLALRYGERIIAVLDSSLSILHVGRVWCEQPCNA